MCVCVSESSLSLYIYIYILFFFFSLSLSLSLSRSPSLHIYVSLARSLPSTTYLRRVQNSFCGQKCLRFLDENHFLSTSDFQSEVGEVFGEIGGELPAKFGRRFSSFFCWGKSPEAFSTKTPPQISPLNFTTRFWVVAGPNFSLDFQGQQFDLQFCRPPGQQCSFKVQSRKINAIWRHQCFAVLVSQRTLPY